MAIKDISGSRGHQGIGQAGSVRKQTGAQLGIQTNKNSPVKQGANLATSSTDQITSSDSDFITLGFKVGQRLSLQGLGKSDGVYRATAVAAGAITVLPAIVSTVSGDAKGILRLAD